MKEISAQKEWKLAEEEFRNNDYISQLYHLYNVLKNIPIDNDDSICRINSLRELVFSSLEMKELELLMKENIYKTSHKLDISKTELMMELKPIELLNEFRLLLLFQYDDFSILNKQDFFNLLEQVNKYEELNFWFDYLLLHDPLDSEVIFKKALIYYGEGKYKEAIHLVDKIKNDIYLEKIKINCLIKIEAFEEALGVIKASKVMVEEDNYIQKIRVLEEKNLILKDCEDEFKELYIKGISEYLEDGRINILASSPYIQKYLSQDAEEIYHYSDVNGMLGVIDNQQFWATKNDFLNDYKEHNFIIDILGKVTNQSVGIELDNIKKAIKRYFDSISYKKNIEKSNDMLDEFIDDDILKDYLNEVYLISNSTNPDNLTLWGNYSNFVGYNIGFNRKSLISDIKSMKGDKSYNYVVEGKVKYLAEKEESNIVSELINEIYNDLKRKNVKDYLITKVIIAHLLLISNFIKHSSMSHEEEYRILFIKTRKDSIVNYMNEVIQSKIRVKGSSLVPFIVVPINNKSSLRSVTIGPTNNMDISEKGVVYLLQKKGYGECVSMVNKSKITLRY